MNPRLRAKLDSLVGRLGDLERLLAAENATRDMEQFRRLSREHSEVSSITSLYEAYRQAERDAAEARKRDEEERRRGAGSRGRRGDEVVC